MIRPSQARYLARRRGEDVPLLCNKFTDKECSLIRRTYSENVGLRTPWLKTLAQMLGRSRESIVRKALSLGCKTDRKRTVPFAFKKTTQQQRVLHRQRSPEQKAIEFKESHRGKWKRYVHPRGMLGKKHSPIARTRMSAFQLGSRRPPFTEEHKMKLRRSAIARLTEKPGSLFSRGKGGRRGDLGNRYFRSRYEANYARFLNFTKQVFEYETKTFWFTNIKRGARSYTIDFFLPAINEYHEVKGWMDAKSATKLKRMKKYHPDIKIVIIDGEFFKALNRQGICRLIPGWECMHKNHQPIVKPEGEV